MISNCGANSGRDDYIRELRQYIDVHMYGKCAPGWDADPSDKEWWGGYFGDRNYRKFKGLIQDAPKGMFEGSVQRVVGSYKFYLAFENTVADGYVTEKFWTPIRTRTIPVYFGAPGNVRKLGFTKLPHYVDASDFSSPKELGEFLLRLGSSEREYESYHAWREQKYDVASKTWLMPHVSSKFLSDAAFKTVGEEELSLTNAAAAASGYMPLQKRYRRVAVVCRLCHLLLSLRRATGRSGYGRSTGARAKCTSTLDFDCEHVERHFVSLSACWLVGCLVS